MKSHLLKSLFFGLFIATGTSNVLAQTTIVVKDQANTKGQTVTYADGSKTVAYTNADNDIWYLGTYDLSAIDNIEVRGAAFVSKGDGTKAQLRVGVLAEGTVTDLTTTGITEKSGDIRNTKNKLFQIAAETTPTTIASGKNATHYAGANFTVNATEVKQNGTYDGTCTLDGNNTVGLQKTTGIYQLFLYGNAISRRLAVDEIIIHYTGEGETSITTTATINADTYVRKGNTTNHGAETTMEIRTTKNNSKDDDFVGLMSFSIPTAAVGKVTKATLKLVTERCKGATTMNVYPYSHDFAESAKYEDEADYITAARNTAPTSFDVAYGVRGKSLASDDISTGAELSKWTNTIDLTSFATAESFKILLASDNNTQSNKFFTKEATDVTNDKNNAYTFSAADLQPQLTITYDNSTAKKSYSLTVGEEKAATLMLPYNTTIPDGVKCYTLNYTSGAEVNATELTDGTLPANTPVLVNAEAGDYTFKATSDTEVLKSATTGALTGVCAKTTVPEGSYILYNGDNGIGFYKVDGTTNTIEANHAYLTAESAQAKALTINYGGQTTSINNISKQQTANNATYTLQGIRVEGKLTPGLYIRNGKKIIIR